MDLPLSAAVDYLMHAYEQEKERYAWELWKSMYPNMTSGVQKFIKFEDFKSKLFEKNHKLTQKSDNEIINEMTAIIAMHEGR